MQLLLLLVGLFIRYFRVSCFVVLGFLRSLWCLCGLLVVVWVFCGMFALTCYGIDVVIIVTTCGLLC